VLTKNLIVLVPVLALCLVALVPLAACAGSAGSIPLEPGPVIIDTTKVTTEPTLLPTLTEPTTERTTEPTTERTTVPTTEPLTPIGGGQGWIDVHCNVDGASVYFNGKYEGQTSGGILSVAVSSTGTPISTITVTKSGYQEWSGAPAHMPAENEHVAVYATLNPLTTAPTTVPTTIPPVTTGQIYAQSSPTGAAIYLNGNFQGYAPLGIPNLYPGTYSMKASLAGYTPDTTLVTVYAGQTANYYPVLQLSPQPRQTGTVYVNTVPNQASVYVDGSYYGKTPITLTLYPGGHTIDIRLAGYNDYTTNVMVNAGQSQNIQVTLSTAIFGSITVNSAPGAKVYMDSTPIGTTNSAGVLQQTGITSGNHLFKVTKSGYNDWMNTIYVQANTMTTIPATLTPVGTNPTPVQGTGSIAISSTPSNAGIYIDDLFRGYTPTTVDNLAAGSHTVRLTAAGYVDYTTTTTVVSGQTAQLQVAMTTAPTPTATPFSPGPAPVLVIGLLAAVFGIAAISKRRS
jgi:hypothetical protein